MKNFKLFPIILAIVFLGQTLEVNAWSGPTMAAPNGNVSAPLNTGVNSQYKSGFLQINANTTDGTAQGGFAFSVPNAASWFGSIASNGIGLFGLSGGASTYVGNSAEGLFGGVTNYVLRAKNNTNSDIYFQTYNGASTNMIIKNAGNVGIGTITPSKKLEVVGGPIKATGGLIIETRTSAQGDPISPETGRMWLMVP